MVKVEILMSKTNNLLFQKHYFFPLRKGKQVKKNKKKRTFYLPSAWDVGQIETSLHILMPQILFSNYGD